MTNNSQSDTDQFLSPSLYRTLIFAIGLYFIVRLLYFAFVIPHETPPDEAIHLERVIAFQEAFLLPSADLPADQAHLRISRHSPYLFYLIAGKWLSTNILPVSDLAYLRLLSIAFTCLFIYYGWRFISLLSENRLVHLVFLILLTNTLMLSLISASASYDALTNLLCAMMIYYFAEFTIKRSPASLIYLLVAMGLGGLVKITILPLACIIVLCLLVLERKNLGSIKNNIKPSWTEFGKLQKGCAFIALFVIMLNSFLYGSNIIQFGHLVPKANQLLSDEEILTNPVFARNEIYVDFLQGEYTIEESLERAKQIKSKAGSLDTMNLLRWAAHQAENGETFEPVSRVAYAYPWYRIMLRSTYGILGHTITVRSFTALIPFNIIFVLTLLSMGWQLKKGNIPAVEIAMIVAIAFYGLVLMQLINYPAYRTFHAFHISVQGRYLFPLIVPIYAFIAKYMLEVSSTRLQGAIALVLIGLYVYGDFIFYLSEWG